MEKLTVEKSLALLNYGRILKGQNDLDGIQGMIDTLIVLYGNENFTIKDETVETTILHLQGIKRK